MRMRLTKYLTLNQEGEEALALLCYTRLVDNFDLFQPEFSDYHTRQYWTVELAKVVRAISIESDTVIGVEYYEAICLKLFNIMFKDNEWFYRDNGKPYKYVIDINKRADLQLTNSLFYSG